MLELEPRAAKNIVKGLWQTEVGAAGHQGALLDWDGGGVDVVVAEEVLRVEGSLEGHHRGSTVMKSRKGAAGLLLCVWAGGVEEATLPLGVTLKKRGALCWPRRSEPNGPCCMGGDGG